VSEASAKIGSAFSGRGNGTMGPNESPQVSKERAL
jgi:hypothetical protein